MILGKCNLRLQSAMSNTGLHGPHVPVSGHGGLH